MLDVGEFLGGVVVRILGFHCCGQGSIPGWGTKIPQAMWSGQKKISFGCYTLFLTQGNPLGKKKLMNF